MGKVIKRFYFVGIVPLIFIFSILVARYTEGHVLFHSLAEIFTVLVGITMAVVSYFTYQFTKNNFLLYLGLGFFWIALLHLFHMLTFKGVMIYSVYSVNTTLTFAVSSHLFEALLLITAPFINFSIISKTKLFLLFGFNSAFIYWLAFSQYRPNLFIEDIGTTSLKIAAEYTIIIILIAALFVYTKKRKLLDQSVYRYMISAILFIIVGQFTFTLYADIHGYIHMLGHIFRFLAIWMIFLAIVHTLLYKPFTLMAQESSTYEAIPIPAIVVDSDGIIRQVNKAAENFLNLTKDEILHHSNHTLFHDKNIKESECEICEGIRNGGKLSSYEVFKDPQICNFTVSPINLSNKSTGAIQVCIDMSKDRLAQQELKKLQTAIEQTPVSIVITDVEGNLEYVNPQFLKVTGYTEEEVIGKNPSVLATGYTTDDEYVELWNKIKSGETWSGIFKNIKKNGEEYWETAVISPIRDAGGNIVNYIGVKQDISEKIALESLLKDQEELMIVQSRHAAMGEMIGMIAHQWRQPLSTISMGANNLLLDITLNKVETSSFKEISNLIISQVNYLSNTIDDFKDFFRPKKEKESVSIEDIINDTLSIIGKTLEDSGVEINTIFSSKPIIKTYKREFIQVLINILNNSKEAMNENSSGEKKLFINVKEEKESTIIEICDNGGGIDEHIINNIFEPYFSTKSEKTGTGLGLYMSKTIVEKHLNGKLIAKNNKIGGACFIIILF